MATRKRQEEIILFEALLTDIQKMHGALFSCSALRHTINVVRRRYASEGISFLTKTLPRLGKAFDKAIAGGDPLDATKLRLAAMPGSKLPRFLGEFTSVILDKDGVLLPEAHADHVRVVRDVCYLFYKYQLPYSSDTEQAVLDQFEKTEQELLETRDRLLSYERDITDHKTPRSRSQDRTRRVVLRARALLNKVFAGLDLTDIVPSHGPGAVATRQQLWEKYEWTNVSSRITTVFPLDAYFYASLGAVCDQYRDLDKITDRDLPARVILVPKDSRGPRLISCEPVDFQWIQQGIMRRVVQHVEKLNLTRFNIHFTDQSPNQCGALLGSRTGRYVTLDLKEASDRISIDLVRLLFPSDVCQILEAARSVGTVMPDGKEIKLLKFAPMGSALCFPVLALTIWSILTAAAPDMYTRERILVYGDDVIVPKGFALDAIEQLESFGLKVNRDKSCLKGLFRESCGMDAFKGVCVTPVRLRTVWASSAKSEVYTSWIAYANSMYDRRYYTIYDRIVELLRRSYGEIPSDDMQLACPSLREVPESMRPKRVRTNHRLQRREWRVLDVKDKTIRKELNGWSMLLRYFTEGSRGPEPQYVSQRNGDVVEKSPFSVRVYTPRGRSMLRYVWRSPGRVSRATP